MQAPILPEPPEQLKQISRTLTGLIRDEITENGPIPFARFMERALYEPGLGYYSAGLHKLGREGDFVTAPEIGNLFATCLARQALELREAIGPMDILELGAGTGKLAADLLRALPRDHWPGRYRILERSADLRAVQQETIEQNAPDCLDRVEWLDRPPDTPWRGLLLANEIIDALAVERFRIGDSGIEQECIDVDGDRFITSYRPAPPALAEAVERLDLEVEPGYCSEIQPGLAAWLDAVTRQMESGLALFFDYGYPRGEYYLPERRDGTFMCHYRHRAHSDLFFWPGLQDITAWVDFTALAESADLCGLDVEGYCSQAMFLLGSGLDRAVQQAAAESDDGGLAVATEARQLTLPGMMGEKFQVMGLGRDLAETPVGFSLQDLRYRL